METNYSYNHQGTTIVSNKELRPKEIKHWYKLEKSKYPADCLDRITLEFQEDTIAKITSDASRRQPLRIRRITGYLVGTLDKFNDYKRAEEAERVKHFTLTAKTLR